MGFTPAPDRAYLIVNADDFGQSDGINLGVIRAHTYGIVTSASLMVRWPAARQAAALARGRPRLDVGLHLDLGEWYPDGGGWRPRYRVVELDDPPEVEREMREQLAVFLALVGAAPTHLDSHQHVHLSPSVRPAALELARELGIPLRSCAPGISHCGAFYGQTADGRSRSAWITRDRLLGILRSLPPGVHELGCHPAVAEPPGSNPSPTTYRGERLLETEVLCDPEVRSTLTELGIRTLSFADLLGEGSGAEFRRAGSS